MNTDECLAIVMALIDIVLLPDIHSHDLQKSQELLAHQLVE